MKTSRIVLAVVAVAAVGYAAWHFTRPGQKEAAAPPAVPVSAAPAKTADVPVYLRAIGAVRALNSVDIRPQVGGVLLDVPVKEGDEVTKGQVIAVIDPRPLKAAVDKAQAQLVQDQAQLDNAQLDRQRYATLASREFASRQQLDTQVSTVNRLQGVIASDKAAIDEAQINLGFAVLRAPFDGRVGIRKVDAGNLIQANSASAIITVVQEKPTSVIFNMPETDLPTIRAASNKAPLPVLADTAANDANDAKTLGKGTLATVDNTVDPSTGTVQLRAIFPNEDDALTAGQFVNVRLQVDVAHGTVVPHTALQHAQQGLYVFTIDPDKSIKRQEVKLIYDDGTQSVVDGVDANAQVVTAGQTRVGPGTKVTFKENDKAQQSAAPRQSAAQ